MKIELKIGRHSVEEIAPLVSCHSSEELQKILDEWTHTGPEITRKFNRILFIYVFFFHTCDLSLLWLSLYKFICSRFKRLDSCIE
jgi:hypothetical protein